jgi:hypothetical protein
VATAAAQGSLEDLSTLSDSIPNVPTSQALLFLPALYENLDPDRIPHIDEVHTNMADFVRGLAVIKGLHNSQLFIPGDALADLWPRYWAWTQFVHVWIGTSQATDTLNEHDFCRNVVSFLACLLPHQEIVTRVAVTPGVRELLSRAWSLLIRSQDSSVRDTGFNRLTTCIMSIQASQPNGMEEYVDGAGGTMDNLAQLVSQTMAELVRGPRLSAEKAKILRNILSFITNGFRDLGTPGSLNPLCRALHARGFAGLLAKSIDSLGGSTGRVESHALGNALRLLSLFCYAPGGHSSIAQALEANFLHALLACGNQPPASLAQQHLNAFLKAILPVSLMYYPVVRAMEHALLAIRESAGTFPLAKTDLWKSFVTLARERLEILHSMDSDTVQLAACDNLDVSHRKFGIALH